MGGHGGRHARELLAAGLAVREAAAGLLREHAAVRAQVRRTLEPLTSGLARAELARMPVARLKDVTEGRLRVDALEQAGYATVLEVLDATEYRLREVPGVGAQTAARLTAAAGQLEVAAAESVAVRIDFEDRDQATTDLVVALARLAAPDPTARRVATRLDTELGALLVTARPTRGRLRLLLAGRERAERARAALESLAATLDHERSAGTPVLLAEATADLLRVPTEPAAWTEFEHSAAEFYGLLQEVAGGEPDPGAATGYLPSELADHVNAHPLDPALRRVSLRGYQSFGARFALAQRRVIIGDEMGLGKSVQAIAVLSHLSARGGGHFLVVSPTGVLVNWLRELADKSTLGTYRVHGPDRAAAYQEWLSLGGVAVTTTDSLHALEPPRRLDALVVDEAHMVKNPETRRARAVADWADRTDRVLFLTGTPMENRVGEFRNLVHHLRPDLLQALTSAEVLNHPDGFRRAVAPVYLRRNQKDVLTELPRLVLVDEWTELTPQDTLSYRAAVQSGNFSAMRTAAYADPAHSAKLARITEIVSDAAENGLKVVVFSTFHRVLNAVAERLAPVTGPLTGATPALRRQEMVDRFSATDGHAVLVSQIQAGGVGLNIQAASVVILCEPQIKPSLEHQAIARAHRMGQVRTVRAHRLLSPSAVDQRILDLLTRKTRTFDAYARRSDLAEATPQAIDISDDTLARQIVEAEQARFAP